MTGYRSGVPDNWFVDPVQLGVPGVRRPLEGEDGNPLGWQTDALCAQTDPEAFFPEKGGSTRDAKKICTTCDVRGSASNTRCRTTSASGSGADSASANVGNSSVARAEVGRAAIAEGH